MASAMRVLSKSRSSDGRIKIATLSGVSALVAVIALLVGVLPVFAGGPGSTGEGVNPVPVDWGGGSGACSDDLISLDPDDEGTARGPSAARYEFHINNPVPGETLTYTGPDPDGTQITITVDANDEFFEFSIGSGMAAYDVVVNGGKKSNHYEYDGGPGIVLADSHLSAPTKDNKPNEVHKLSHVNICYDVPVVTFECGGDAEFAFRFGDGLSGEEFTEVTARVFTVDGETDCTKDGIFFINNEDVEPTVKLDFGSDGPTVVGRADFKKVVEDPNDLDGLRYDPTESGDFVEMQWCNLDEVDPAAEHEFDDVLETDEYPSLLDDEGNRLQDGSSDAIACKVYEEEDASGFQHTVVYFEFEDPRFR